jgi:hypothetical protein
VLSLGLHWPIRLVFIWPGLERGYLLAEHLDFGFGQRLAGQDFFDLAIDVGVLRLGLHAHVSIKLS